MTSFHVSRMRTCMLAAAVAQALIVVPSVAQIASVAQEQTKKSETSAKAPVELKAVVVTAQRRSQNLQEVPLAVTAIDRDQLDSRGIANVADLSSVAPNLQVSTAPGDASASQISIRGMAGYNPALFFDTPVGIYVDGVYFGKTQGGVFNLLNLERIEVLRGPQGTLFGRNTMAGAISLVTRPPSGEFGGTAELGLGNYGSTVGKVLLDLPAVGKLKASVGGRIERRDGWIKTTPGSSVSELANRRNEQAFAALRYDVTDNLSLDYRYDYSNIDQYPFFNQAIHSELGQLFGIPGIIVNQGRQTRASIGSPAFERSRVEGNALTAAWKLGDAGTLKYIGAYREMHWDDALDLDGSSVAVAQSERFSRYHQSSHELQYLGNVGAWNWVAGLYYFSDKGFTNNPQSFFFDQVTFVSNYDFDTRSRAAYGQVDYKLTDRLTLTAGVRRTNETKGLSRFLVGNGQVLIPAGTHGSKSFGDTTPTVNLSYQLGADHLFYARYAKGFMSGGFNGEAQDIVSALTPYLPQTQKSFEVGTKNTLLDGKATVNANVFYNRIDNLQEPVFTAKGAAGSLVLNVGRAHTEGLEIETAWHPIEDLTLRMNYGYLHTKYDQFMELGVNVADNRALVHAPRHTLSVAVDNTLARTSKGVLRGTLEYRFTSGFFLYPYQLRLTDPTQQLARNSRVGSEGLLNGQLVFDGMDWGHGVYGEVALWVKNLTNVGHTSNVLDFGPGFANLRIANFDEPRTFGINVTARW